MNKTILTGFCALLAAAGTALCQSTAFTYQGRLATNGVAVNGVNDFKFTLFGQTNGGVAAAGPITNFNVGVSNGLFTTALDFGAIGDAFYASDRWLEIATRPAGGGAFTSLSPRQPITATPHTLYANYAGFTSAALTLTGPVPTFSLVGGYPQTVFLTNSANQFRGAFTGSGGGLSNLNASQLTSGTVPDARLSPNVALLNGTNVFTGTNRFAGVVIATNAGNQIAGSGAGLTALNANNLSSGAVADARLSANVPRLNGNNEFTGFNGLNNRDLRLRDAGDQNHGLGWYGTAGLDKRFAGVDVDGPALFGYRSGVLGTMATVPKIALLWNSLGNVGIGTNNPDARLHVADAGETVAIFENSWEGGAWLNLINRSVGGRTWNFISSGSSNSEGPGKLLFRDPAQGVVMTLSTNGNVGIGTDNPATKLAVNGTVTASQFNGPLNGSLSGIFTGGVSASSFKLGSSSVAGSVLVAIDDTGNAFWNDTFRHASVDRPAFSRRIHSANILAGGPANSLGNDVLGATVLGGGSSVSGMIGPPVFPFPNSATADFATVVGGSGNVAAGSHSFAAGHRAKANHSGAFVWADSQEVNFGSAADNQFLIRAAGGVGINTTNPGVSLEVNGGVRARGGPPGPFGNNNNGYAFSGDVGDNDSGMFCSGDGYLEFYSNSGQRMVIAANGNVGIGTNNPQAKLDVNGDVSVCSLTIRGGCDLAEPFDVAEKNLAKGSVVVIDDTHPGRLKLSTQPYDTRVAGIISGANGINPGISLQQEGVNEGGENVALSGRVYVQADASNGAIKPGDLLTTSERPGHAMKVADHTRSQGAILGKAMSSLKEGTGLVLVLVTLQ